MEDIKHLRGSNLSKDRSWEGQGVKVVGGGGGKIRRGQS